VWEVGFTALVLFCVVVVSAGNWTGSIHSSAASSASPAQVFLFPSFNF
jgi:hypothetical protein